MSEPVPNDPRLEAAFRCANDGEFAGSERLLQEVLDEDDACLLALDLLGFVQYFLGRPADAEQACRRALAIDANRAYSNKGLGLCLARLGKLDEGLVYLHRATTLEPTWFDPRWDTAVVLSEAARYVEALEVVAQAERDIPAERPRFTQLREEIRRRMEAP